MKLKIKRVVNGYTLDDGGDKQVFQHNEHGSPIEALQELTYAVWDALGYFGSKHDEQRLRCIIQEREDA